MLNRVAGRCLQGRKITDYGFGYRSAYDVKERRNLASERVLSKLSPRSGRTSAGSASCTAAAMALGFATCVVPAVVPQ